MGDLFHKSLEKESVLFALAQHVTLVKGSGWATLKGSEGISILNRYQHFHLLYLPVSTKPPK